MIQALTEFNNEELNKAATYVLQNCKTISKFTVTLGKYQLAGHGNAHLYPSPGKQKQADSLGIKASIYTGCSRPAKDT